MKTTHLLIGLVLIASASAALATEPAVSKALTGARESTSMPLIGNTMAVLGEDNYVHRDDVNKGTITAAKGDYFVIISFNRVVTREEIEQCCSVTDQDGQKLSYGVLIGRGSTSLLGYYVSPKGRGPKLVFRDNDASVDLNKLMK